MRPLLLLLAAAATTLAHPGSGIVVDRSGQIYFVLSGPAERIMRIDTRGNLSAFVTDERVRGAHHLVIDELGNLYTVSESESVVWQIKPDGQILRAYPHLTRRRASRIGAWGDPFTLDRDGNIYCIGYPERTRILRISPRGVMTSFAGGVSSGHADGPGAKARFGNLHGSSMAWGPDKRPYLTDRSRIRKLAPDGTVSTVTVNGGFRLERAMGLALNQQGEIYVADYGTQHILKLTPPGQIAVVAGPPDLAHPTGVAVGLAGEVYVLDHPQGATRVSQVFSSSKVGIIAVASASIHKAVPRD